MSDLKTVQQLEQLESEIQNEAYEAFYQIGQRLLRIRRERLYESAGFKSWASYCKSGRIEFTKQHADGLIRASELRPKLESIDSNFTESQMRELCKCETDNDAKRVAEKSVALAAKRGQRLTAKLIAQVRDSAEETGNARAMHDEQLEQASLDSHIGRLCTTIMSYRISLEQVERDLWQTLSRSGYLRLKEQASELQTFVAKVQEWTQHKP